MLSKNCTYNGPISMELKNNKFEFKNTSSQRQIDTLIYFDEDKFEFKPVPYKGQITILIDFSEDKFDDKLSVIISKFDDDNTILTLFKTDRTYSKDEILKLSLKSNSFSIDSKDSEKSEYSKIAEVRGSYTATSKCGLVDVVFVHNDNTTFSIICNLQKNILESYKWLSTFWKRYYPSGEFCVSLNNVIVDQTRRFSDYVVEGIVKLYVDEKCRLTPITEDDDPVAVPWSEDSRVMERHLSRILDVECDKIRLFDGEKKLLTVGTELDSDDFRSDDALETLGLFYVVEGATIRCEAMIKGGPLLEVMVVRERTVGQLKERLAFKMKVDWTRLIICGEKSRILREEEAIPMDEKLKYCCVSRRQNITKKTVVGGGAFGTIYACTDTSSGDAFALKVFTDPLDDKTKCKIVIEVLVNSCVVPHDNIVKYIGTYVDNDNVSIVMEYMAGGSLHSYLTGPLDEEEIRIFSRDILRGLSHLHGLDILHRDLKSDNVMLTSDRRTAKLCDFGLSKILTDYSRSENNHTSERGTWRFMAPEVICGEKYGRKADVWSFGATVVQMITGELPCGNMTNEGAIFYISTKKSIPFDSSRLSSSLKELVGGCLASESVDRLPCDRLLSLPFFLEETVSVAMTS